MNLMNEAALLVRAQRMQSDIYAGNDRGIDRARNGGA